MKSIKTVLFDIYNGILKHYLLFVCPAALTIFLCMDCIHKIDVYLSFPGQLATEHSFGDVWFYIYGGMEKYVPSRVNPFQFPVIWTIIFATCSLLVLNYPLKDMLGIGSHILVRGGSRTKWWLSKIIWNVLSTIVYHLVVLLVIILSCIIAGISLRPGLNVTLQQTLYEFQSDVELYFRTFIPIQVLFLPVLVSVAMNILQMTLALFMNPTYSFIMNCVLMVSSAYIMSPFMPYNYAMPLRYGWVYLYGFNYLYGYLAVFIIILLSLVAGFVRFSKYDIIKKEDN